MLTPARLRQLWQNARYRRLLQELLAGRPEGALGLESHLSGPIPAAALALLRLGELRQGTLPAARPFLEHLLLAQQRTGAWGEGAARPISTALCIRGLDAVERGRERRGLLREPQTGAAEVGLGLNLSIGDRASFPDVLGPVERGIAYLAWGQSPGGKWNDGFTTAIVLLQLGRVEAFRRVVRIASALECRHRPGQGAQERLAWSHVCLRCGGTLRAAAMQQAGADCGSHHRPLPLFANVA